MKVKGRIGATFEQQPNGEFTVEYRGAYYLPGAIARHYRADHGKKAAKRMACNIRIILTRYVYILIDMLCCPEQYHAVGIREDVLKPLEEKENDEAEKNIKNRIGSHARTDICSIRL
jgi:hypothetical protein